MAHPTTPPPPAQIAAWAATATPAARAHWAAIWRSLGYPAQAEACGQ